MCVGGSQSGILGRDCLGGRARPHLPLSLSVPASPLARLSTAMARNTFNRMSGVSSGYKDGEAACLWSAHVPIILPQPCHDPASQDSEDTVAADEEDDEVHAYQHPWEEGAAIGHDTIIHDHIPVLTCQDLGVGGHHETLGTLSPTLGPPALPTHPIISRSHLKDSEEGLGEGVKGASLSVCLVKVELAPKQLHAKQGEDDDKEEEEKQQGCNGFH